MNIFNYKCLNVKEIVLFFSVGAQSHLLVSDKLLAQIVYSVIILNL